MSTSTSLLPLLAVGVLWYYLSLRGAATQTIWLLLNILDTFKALRHIRANGRRIGINTRKKVMRETLSCWTIYVLARTIGPIISILLGWIPFFSPVKAILCVAFLFMRVAASCHIFQHLLVPTIKPYESSIDLTVLLIQSIGVLIFHYLLQVPFALLITATSYSRASIISSFHTILDILKSQTHPPNSTNRMANDRPTVDKDHVRASLLSPPPQIPGSILLRHPSPRSLTPRRSISFLSPPNTPKILLPSPPSSDGSDEIQIVAGPSTPRRVVHGDNEFLGVMEAKDVRRSPRRSKPSEPPGEEKMESSRTSARRGTARPTSQIDNMAGNDNIITSSIKKGKSKAVPILIIPDEDEEEDIVPVIRVIRNDRRNETERRPLLVDEMRIPPQARNELSVKPTQNRSRTLPRSISTNVPELSSATNTQPSKSASASASIQNSQRPTSASRSTTQLNPRTTTKPSEFIKPPKELIARSKSSSTRSVKPNTTATTTTTTAAQRSKPKTPRKPKTIKSSEGGVSHDKPLSTAASRSKAIIRTRARSKTAEIVDVEAEPEEKKEELGKKVGEKRRRVAPPGIVDVRESRKRVKKE